MKEAMYKSGTCTASYMHLVIICTVILFGTKLYGKSFEYHSDLTTGNLFLEYSHSTLTVKNTPKLGLESKWTVYAMESPVDRTIDLSKYTYVFVDSTKQMSYKQVFSNLENLNFVRLSSFEFGDKYSRGKHAYWLIYAIENKRDVDVEIGIDLGVFDSIQTYIHSNDILVQKTLSGNRVEPKNTKKANIEIATYFRSNLKTGQTYQYLSRIVNDLEINRKISPILINPLRHEKNLFSRFTKVFSFQAAFLAILFIVFFINLFQYFLNKEKAFIFYSIYILLLFAFFSRDFYCTSPIILFDVSPICSNTFISPLVISNFILYGLFVIAFLETKKEEPFLHKSLLIGIRICLVYLVVERLIDIWDPYLAWKLYGYFKIAILFAMMIIIFLITRIKNPLSFFILTGTLALLISTIITAILSFRPVHFVNYLDTTYIPQYIGILLELFFFSIGLGYKTKLTEYEKRKAKSELVLKNLEIAHEKELGTVRSHFFTQVTHEFRTPLTVILGMVDNLKSNLKNIQFPKAERSLEMIRRNGKNLLRLVNEMLDMAKLESGVMELKLVQADIVPFIKYVCESFQSYAKESQINLTVYSEIDALKMDFDSDRLTAVISNLLSNALKFTNPDDKIIVHLRQLVEAEKKFLIIKVKDNGLGISEEAKPYIFDQFYQAGNTPSLRGEGTGIGLALTKEFVELMQGTIEVKSELGKGSEFIVKIPVSKIAGEVSDIYQPLEPQKSAPVETQTLLEGIIEENTELPLALIIEDNTDVAYYLGTCLKGKYKTLHAPNGLAGIEMAFENIPDIIISDVMMPYKDGYEVCDTLKNDERTDHIPIILLTAKATREDRIMGLAFGADAYLSKPFNKPELFTRLDQLVLLRKKILDKFEKTGLGSFLKMRAENPETKFLQKIIKIIHQEISNHSFGSRHLARKLNLSESQIYRKLKAVTGKSTAIFIRSVRLQRAKELIQTTGKTISEIAYDVGFNDPSWFSRAFREEFGYAPSELYK